MISAIFEWAWRCGLDVKLTSKTYLLPDEASELRVVSREASNFVNMSKAVVEMPVLVFSRRNKNMSVEAINWAQMASVLEHQHGRIFNDLLCEPLKFERDPQP